MELNGTSIEICNHYLKFMLSRESLLFGTIFDIYEPKKEDIG